MQQDFDERVCALIEALDLGRASDVRAITPLTGGVSSEIALVELPGHKLCVKFALAKLKVAADWYAPIHRNLAEYRWLEYVAKIAPDNVPRLYGHDDTLGGFVMEFVSGADVHNWKAQLLQGPSAVHNVRSVAELLGRIHECSIADSSIAARFDNADDFHALRIEPYLESLAAPHTDLAEPILAMAKELAAARIGLVHGDVSPKNILLRGRHPLLLDAECATIGDPAFDVAFCLNHFLLKGIHAPRHASAFVEATSSFLDAYSGFLSWEGRGNFEARLARLLPMLLLARVDGKSPVEYLDARQQAAVRRSACHAIASPSVTITPLINTIMREAV